ncbi:DnaD domain protein [Limosilactobacillus sp. c9Ua_26_M]|uniref:DnaD domain protein n=1 Tax=Limosilactobacillus urinaemulieris TaxID=2742600 RepID=A0ABR8ZIX4_9LACO|nr:DnaD domain protein [Limosilactobacillus urinaemulieris]MBD8084989.1 DnaD domain protein [Limosilactobacillus urinaemulieris]
MTKSKSIFDPGAGYIVTASHQWSNFNENVFELFYQPILGTAAFAMFHALRTQLNEKPAISDRHLQSQLLVQLNAGLQTAEEGIQRLEATGMLRTFTQTDQLGDLFVYELQPTLTPAEFINDNLLSILLLEAVGEARFKELGEFANRFALGSHQVTLKEITHNFFDAFHVNDQRITHLPTEITTTRKKIVSEKKPKKVVNVDFDWPTLVQLLKGQPITEKDLSSNRDLIEVEHQLYGIDEPTMARLITQSTDLTTSKIRPQRLKQIIAGKYRVDAKQPGKEKVSEEKGTVTLSQEEQQLIETCKYYAPVTFLQQLKQQMGGFVTSGERAIIRNLIQEQQLDAGVVNILSWYVIASLKRPTLQANYVNAIANNWMRAGVATAEEALAHIHEFNDQKAQKRTSRQTNYYRRQTTTVREKMPAWANEDEQQIKKPTPEQLERLRQRLARRKKSGGPEGDESK